MFWELAPCELHREIEVARLIHQDALNAQIVLAWQIEAIRLRTRAQKRLPDLSAVLIADAPLVPAPMDVRAKAKQQRDTWLMWAQLHNIPIRHKGH